MQIYRRFGKLAAARAGRESFKHSSPRHLAGGEPSNDGCAFRGAGLGASASMPTCRRDAGAWWRKRRPGGQRSRERGHMRLQLVRSKRGSCPVAYLAGRRSRAALSVMPELVPGIHAVERAERSWFCADGRISSADAGASRARRGGYRDKPGHDGGGCASFSLAVARLHHLAVKALKIRNRRMELTAKLRRGASGAGVGKRSCPDTWRPVGSQRRREVASADLVVRDVALAEKLASPLPRRIYASPALA
jgi:hypothetical protein